MQRKFIWDRFKAAQNVLKHGVTFEEAEDAFRDPFALIEFDSEHSSREDRFVLLGASTRLRVLFVVHAYLENDTIRIISARPAKRREQEEYEAQFSPESE